MIVVMRNGATREQVRSVVDQVNEMGFRAHLSTGQERTIIGVIGDERPVNEGVFRLMEGVEKVVRILRPFKLASRDFHPDDTVIEVGDVSIGGPGVTIMAGPCSVEDRSQLMEAAHAVKEAGFRIMRAGVFKPRTSPYSFQGLGNEGLEMLSEVKAETGLLFISEVMAPEQIPAMCEHVDILQVGTRNMQNFNLLHAVGESGMPVMLKRGMMSTMEELLMSAEYILSHGNYRVMLCERGIRTFETYTRNTLDISAVPVLKQMTHLPVFIDPSHATGNWEWVTPLAMAGVAAGADGLIIEVHPHPEKALSDGAQSLRPERFYEMVDRVRHVARAVGREL
jgi:3-deoxy-7-phosphoheptulonate synthase